MKRTMSASLAVFYVASTFLASFASAEQCDDICGKPDLPKGGQVETQCLAYKATKFSQPFEDTLLALDMAATASCAAACATSWTGGWTQLACSVAGISASVTELTATIQQKGSPIGKAVTATIDAAAGGAAGLQEASELGKLGGGTPGGKLTDQSKVSCAAAALYAIMTAMRVSNRSSMSRNKNQACQAVIQLASNAANMDTLTSAAQKGSAGTIGGGQNPNASIGILGQRMGAANNSNTIPALQCVQDKGIGGCPIDGMQAGATDADMLSKSGMDRGLAEKAKGIDLAAIDNQLKSGMDAGSIVAGAMAGGSSDLANKIGEVARVAIKDSDSLTGLINVGGVNGTTYASSGGGSRRSGKKPGVDFLSFGGSGAGLTGADSPSAELAFKPGEGKPSLLGKEGDIWHSEWKGTIFQIVSSKLSESRDRVEKLEWATELNRAMMGLPNPSRQPASTGRSGFGR